MKRKILTNLAALSLLFGVASMQGSYMGHGFGAHYGNGYGYGYGYPSYGYAPSIVGPAYVNNPWGYGYYGDGYDSDWLDDWSGFSTLPPPEPNPTGAPKTIEIPPDHTQHHG